MTAARRKNTSAHDFTIVVDTREQRPLDFGPGVPTVRRKIDAGDYSVDGYDGAGGISIERKSTDDLFGTIIADRARFERELVRLTAYTFRALVVEASMREILEYTSPASTGITDVQRAARPATVINSLATYAIEYGLHVFYTDRDRRVAAALVLRLAERFVRAARARAQAQAQAQAQTQTPSAPIAPVLGGAA